MSYAVCVTWTAKPGEQDAVASAIQQLIEPSRAEPGVELYQAHRDPRDQRRFFLYELYSDEAAYQAHVQSAHFQKFGLGEAIPRLESRERAFYQSLR